MKNLSHRPTNLKYVNNHGHLNFSFFSLIFNIFIENVSVLEIWLLEMQSNDRTMTMLDLPTFTIMYA